MVVLVLTACPAGLRGHITRWLLEISPGVFVGHVSSRVRDELWSRVVELCKDGKAILVFSVRGEQRVDFRVHRHDWEIVNIDGLSLVRRPPTTQDKSTTGMRRGWSKAGRYRQARKKLNTEQPPRQ